MKRSKETGQSEIVRRMDDAATENPWQTVSTETRYENPWIVVTHNKVINPAGNEGIYGKVHFKNKAIAILPLDQDNTNHWTEFLYAHMSNSVSDEEAYGFIAQDLQFTEAQPEETEDLARIKLPFDEALQMALNGKITDILAVTCLLKAAHLLDKGVI